MESYCSICTLETMHRLLFVTRLIINKINKVQWVDFMLENVLVSIHSLKTMGHGPFSHDKIPRYTRAVRKCRGQVPICLKDQRVFQNV